MALYRKWGKKAFIKNQERRQYSRETKLKAIKEHFESNKSYRQIAIDLMLTEPGIVSDWVAMYKEKGEESIKDTCSREAYKHHDDKVLEKEYKKLLLEKNLLEDKNLYVYKRDFETSGPYQKLGTNITVFIMPYGKLYLSPIIDFHTREILGYNVSNHPDYRQIDKMIKNLEKKHGKQIKEAILHSDQGWQYQMKRYQEKLKQLEIEQSMSRKRNCLDNSPTENFFGRMKEEMFYGKEYLYSDMDKLIKAIVKYIEYYNEERIVNKFHMSPLAYKIKLLSNQSN